MVISGGETPHPRSSQLTSDTPQASLFSTCVIPVCLTFALFKVVSLQMCAFLNWDHFFFCLGKRRYSIKIWKTFTDCFNCLPIAAIIDNKIFCCHGGKPKTTVDPHRVGRGICCHGYRQLLGLSVATYNSLSLDCHLIGAISSLPCL